MKTLKYLVVVAILAVVSGCDGSSKYNNDLIHKVKPVK
jgi:hypothetical protein